MRYEIEVTPPVKIRSIETYKHRIDQIVFGQLKNAFHPYKFANIFFWILCLLAIPMTILYAILSLSEIVLDTVFLPLSLIPIVRFIPIAFELVFWGFEVAIGYFSATDMTFFV